MKFTIYIVISPTTTHPYVQTHPMSKERHDALKAHGCSVYSTVVEVPCDAPVHELPAREAREVC